ncbi:DMT family transporter [Streptomyces sp. NRRL S-813]|uniref:DMT family transporter n=1 Tax=Streptomyces sp. NRRL S-813 TaxID=1463919 RepID=UPI0004BF0710|nr:DMT family transporter [Streptomyces sp. NRRL S-813]
MSALALSVLLSLVSAVAYAGGAIVQERVAVSAPGEQYAPLRRPAWWAAVALNGLGGLLHVVALACGPLSLVQPLGALTIVFALPMAALFVGRRAGAAAWRGAIMATVGLAGLLSLVGASGTQSLSAAQRLAVAVVTGGAVVALTVAGRAAHRHPAVRSVLLATGSGIAFGMSSVFTKTVAVDWSDGVSAADLPSLAAIGVLATAGMLLSQASYRGGGLAAPLATLTVVNPVVAAAVGITMFGETFRYGTTGTVLALACGVVATGGLILLTTERLERADESLPAGETAVAGPASEGLALGGLALGGLAPEEQIPDEVPATGTLPNGTRTPEVPVPGQADTEPTDTLVPAAPSPGAAGIGAAGIGAAGIGAAGIGAAGAKTAGAGAAAETGRGPGGGEAPPSPGVFHAGPYCPGPLCGVPFYGGAYVPMPVLDRRRSGVGVRVRVRVRS